MVCNYNYSSIHYHVVQMVVSNFDSENWFQPNVSPLLHEHLQDSDIECHYFGCYYADDNYYLFELGIDYGDIVHRVTFPNATCTFSQG